MWLPSGRRRPVATALFLLFLVAPLRAENLISPLRDARFVRLSAEHGLSQDTVQAVLQDHRRFLWFGTEEGLNRYDGYRFEVFKHEPGNPESLPHNFILSLYEDRAHRLWVGTLEGLSLFDPATSTFKTYKTKGSPTGGFDQTQVSSIVEDRAGNLWVGIDGSGLARVDPATGAFVDTYRHAAGDVRSLSGDKVNKVFVDRAGVLWVGTVTGLNRFDPETRSFVRYLHGADEQGLGHDFVWDMVEDRDGHLWVATYGGGLSVLDPVRERFRRYQKKDGRIPNDWITSLFVDGSGAVWAGTDGSGLLQYDPRADRFPSVRSVARDPHSLSKNVVRSIYEDAQKNLWVGTYKGGLSMLQPKLQDFSFYGHNPAVAGTLSDAASVDALLEDREGLVWVGTSEGGLNRLDPETGTFRHYRHDPGDPRSLGRDTVTALHQDRAGRLWVGTHGGGLDRFDFATGAFHHLRHRPQDGAGLSNDYIWAIVEGAEGLWLATNGGVDHYDPDSGRIAHYRHGPEEDSLSHHAVRSLLLEENGDLYVGTMAGLDFLPRGARGFVHFRYDPANPRSLSNNTVLALHRDSRGRRWVGTLGGGLDLFDPGSKTFRAFRVADGLPSDSIYCICEDSRGELWLGTNSGLSRFNPETNEFKNYGLSNGLRSLQFNIGGCRRTRDGRLLFGTSGGFYFFDPDQIKLDLHIPPLLFTSFRLFDQPVRLRPAVSMRDEIRLDHRENVFSLEFAVLDFAVPRGNAYAYRVLGFRPDWTPLGPKHELTFTNLDPGTYTLQVRGSNSDGVWNESGTELRIVVAPPFWATAWFRGLLALALLGLLFGAFRFHARRLAVAAARPCPRCDAPPTP
jgi:ligand-binding sensor domain-containing protein